ncbi:MAG: hypothetical protein K2K89_08715 [Ruminococcus sp.]|nr:hypothetical protein [Ruminococcus sp.]
MTGVSVADYVAHSFAQYIREDEEYIYRLDHGDGAPRALSLSRISRNGSLDDVTSLYYSLYPIRGFLFNGNPTCVSVGGMELSDDNILVAVNSVDMEAEVYDTEGNRNIFLAVASKNASSVNHINITDYTESDGITVCTPQIVKLSSDAFMIMW